MGLLDTLKAPFRKPAAVAVAPPVEPEGVPGGANFSGRLVGYEPTAELRDQSGYGRAGTYDVGQWQQIALSNPFVQMGLDHVLRPIAGARVDVEPPPDSVIGTGPGRISKADADTHTAFVAWALTEHFQLGRLSKVAAAGFLLSGFALFEPLAVEALCPAVAGRSVWALKDVPQRLPNSLDSSQPWRVDETGRLVGIGQSGPVGAGGKWKQTVLAAERALLFSWKREAGNFAGQSQLRTCWYFAAKVMPVLGKMVGVTLQREGPGIPQAISADKDAKLTPVQRAELIEVYANMVAHESAGLVMPAGWRTEWTFSPVSNKGHILDIYERMGLYILQTFGAQQLVLGTGATGTRAVGEVHDARSMAMVEEVLGFLAENYNGARGEADGLVKRLVEWNFGPQVAYPKVKLTAQRPELGPKELGEALKLGTEAGVFTPTLKDENNFRARVGAPPITEEELEEERTKKAARAPSLAPFGQPRPSPPPGPGKKPLVEDLEGEPMKASAPRAPWAPSRPLRASEQKLKLADMDAYFTARREAFEARVRPVVAAMLGVAAPSLERAMADGQVTPEEVAAVPLDTKRLDAVLEVFLQETRKAGAAFVRGELAAGPLVAEQEDDDVVLEADRVVETQKSALRRRIVNRVRGDVEREAIDTMRTGGGAQEVVARSISRQLDTGAFKADAGSVTTKVFNVGRDEAARLMGGVGSVEYSAVLDSATCEPCQAMDGRTAPFDSAEHDAMLPPNRDCAGGDNCRCLLVFIPERGES